LPGQSILVEVKAPDGTAYNNTEKFYIGINGVPGSRQYLQFTRPGAAQILVTTKGAGGIEQQSATVQIQTPPAPAAAAPGATVPLAAHLWPTIGLPVLRIARRPNTRYGVSLNLGDFAAAPIRAVAAAALTPTVTPAVAAAALNPGVARAAAPLAAPARAAVLSPVAEKAVALHPESLRPIAANIALPLEILTTTQYQWDFGDGTRLNTTGPSAVHDFEDALDPEREYQQFTITVTSAGRSVSRTLTVYNAYFQVKSLFGYLAPRVDSAAPARKIGAQFAGTMTVHNPEAEAITLTERRFVPMAADDNAPVALTPIETLPRPITIAAKSSLAISVDAPLASVPIGSVGFSAHYAGKSASGKPVRASAHFDIAARDRTNPKSAEIAASLAALKASGTALTPWVVSNVSQIISSTSAAAGHAAVRLKGDHAIDVADTRTRVHAKLPPVAPPAAAGAVCDPDNLPQNVPGNLACQATAETQQVATPGRFMNARKGDLILSPGGNGLVGQLLRQVVPPQKYDHSGMMTANHTWITHCTASQDRMLASAFFVGELGAPTAGIRPDVVKYGWPGVITQTVENAVGDPEALTASEPFLDPDPANAKTPYYLSAFSVQPQDIQLGSAWVLIPPMVVKPDPMAETEAMRAAMGVIADDAVAQTGKAHYRFYCYSDPTIGESTTAPAGTGWAAGTFPAVCSSFIWLMQKKHGVHLQSLTADASPGDLTSGAIAQGAEVGPATPDGLYLYGAAERLTAATYLYGAVANLAQDLINSKAGGSFIGGIFEAITNTATHIGNEILNSFANDSTQLSDDSTAWQNTKDTNAVSPQNTTYWQSAAKFGGAFGNFGYAEPLIYREPDLETVTIYRWNTVVQKGELSGKVTFNGAAVPDALVQLNASIFTHTDAAGHYEIKDVPYGSYIVTTQVAQDGLWLTAAPKTDIKAAAQTLDIAVKLPSDLYRTLRVTGSLYILWTYSASDGIFGRDRSDQTFPLDLVIEVGPFGTHGQATFSRNVNSATASVTVVADWKPDKSIEVAITFNQDDTVDTNFPGNVPYSFNVPENATCGWGWTSYSNNDSATVKLSLANILQET
jgi:hypothetical protein